MNTNKSPTLTQSGFLGWIERIGNKVPNPFLLFIYMTLFLMIVSAIFSYFDFSAFDPIKKEQVHVKNLLSRQGIDWFLPNMVENFAQFKPLASILTLVFGMGLAERVGLLEAVIRKMSQNVSAKYASYFVIFIAFFSHVSSDAALVIMPPLGAMIFMAVGRHPIAGLLTAIAGVGSGFTANLLIVNTDVLLSGISTEAAKVVDPKVTVSVLDNWFFMGTSVIVLSLLGGLVTDKFVEPRLGTYTGEKKIKLERLTPEQNRALRITGIAALIYIVVIALLVIPKNGLLRNAETGSVTDSPFLQGIVPIILFFFIVVGLTYGICIGLIKKQNDLPLLLTDPIKNMASFIVMVFPLAQFVACFQWSNMGQFLALSITDLLTKVGMTGAPVIVGLMFLGGLLTLFISSGSAIWSILAPVFVPMMMYLGYHPAFTQMIFRVADSSFIPLAPVSAFTPLFLKYLQEYKKDAQFGTYFSMVLPYPISFFIVWVTLVIIWYVLGLPLGPGVGAKL